MTVKMRPARQEEAETAAGFLKEAREYQKEQGFVQWTEEYPNLSDVLSDIAAGKGYILTEDDIPFGYLCIDFDGEPAYDNIQGEWKSSERYAVIHRMAFGKSGRGKGATGAAFRLAKELCAAEDFHTIRIDTDSDNRGMRHILEREGYQYCGTISFQGSPKLAYELDF